MFEHVRSSQWRGNDVTVVRPGVGSGVRLPRVAHLLARFPERELAIRRLFARDARFKEVCEDYEDASKALRHWEAAGSSGEAKAEDYRRIVAELEADVLAYLDEAPANRPPTPDD
jgi:hypothetical protein